MKICWKIVCVLKHLLKLSKIYKRYTMRHKWTNANDVCINCLMGRVRIRWSCVFLPSFFPLFLTHIVTQKTHILTLESRSSLLSSPSFSLLPCLPSHQDYFSLSPVDRWKCFPKYMVVREERKKAGNVGRQKEREGGRTEWGRKESVSSCSTRECSPALFLLNELGSNSLSSAFSSPSHCCYSAVFNPFAHCFVSHTLQFTILFHPPDSISVVVL